MHCFDARFMPAYVDGEFDERDRGEFEAHLRACNDCRTATRFEAWFVQGIKRSVPQTPAPAQLRERILEQLDEVPIPWSQRLRSAQAAASPRTSRLSSRCTPMATRQHWWMGTGHFSRP